MVNMRSNPQNLNIQVSKNAQKANEMLFWVDKDDKLILTW